MKLTLGCAAALGLLLSSLSAQSFAAAPPDAPAGTTGMCKDGSYASAAEKKGACRGHKGVKDWYAEGAAATSAAAPVANKATTSMTPAATQALTSSAAPSPNGTAMAGSTSTKPASKPGSTFTPPATAAAGGGPGMVWANDTSKVYHCSGDKWYGKTKHGEYLSEADAKAKGFHAEHGKACTS